MFQIDGSTMKTLCSQHGPLQAFYLNLHYGQALVRYNTKEEAMKAQKSLNTCILGNTTIIAEFVSDHEAVRLLEQLHPAAAPTQQPVMHGAPQAYNYRPNTHYTTAKQDSNQWNGASTLGPSMWGTGGGLWGGPLEDPNPLLSGDFLGGQQM